MHSSYPTTLVNHCFVKHMYTITIYSVKFISEKKMPYLMTKNTLRNPLKVIIAVDTKRALDDKHFVASTSTKADSNTTKMSSLLFLKTN